MGEVVTGESYTSWPAAGAPSSPGALAGPDAPPPRRSEGRTEESRCPHLFHLARIRPPCRRTPTRTGLMRRCGHQAHLPPSSKILPVPPRAHLLSSIRRERLIPSEIRLSCITQAALND